MTLLHPSLVMLGLFIAVIVWAWITRWRNVPADN